MNKLKTSIPLKTICYILIPIIIINISLNFFSVIFCEKIIYSEFGEQYIYNMLYEVSLNLYDNAPINIAVSSVLLIVMLIYVLTSAGYKKGIEGIYLDALDNIPLGILGIIFGILQLTEWFALMNCMYTVFDNVGISNKMTEIIIILGFLISIAIYATITITVITIIRRIKAKVFIKNTLLYKFTNWINKELEIINETTKSSNKLFLTYCLYTILELFIIFLIISNNIVFIIWLPVLWGFTLKLLFNKLNTTNKIKTKIKQIYEGNKDANDLNEDEFKGELKEVAHELNDISGGLSNAIEEAMKSERLKTELITNVSHDIKTPLTSIINYVDLMKKEQIENEKIKEYLDVLDNKSQRLKKLTEDLVEASKASSGNIKLNMEKLDLKELIKQVGGEFKDKFSLRGLELIENLPEEEVYIEADSKYMYRTMENMYVNITKYALENSRVYIDLKNENGKAKLELKNISQEKLNITADELMQRFVRGDSSRTTEGSGLGISIATSLTNLQGGTFNIYLDGDLFKVVIEFNSLIL